MKYNKNLLLVTFVILSLVILTGCTIFPNFAGVSSTVTQAAPDINDFTLKDLNGEEVSLSDHVGNIVILNFWATWCPPCRAEIPDFIEVYDSYKDKGVSFIGVSLDEDFSALENFVSDYGIDYEIVHDKDSSVSNYWGINAIPTTFFLDKEGNILDSVVGQVPKKTLVSIIEYLLDMEGA